MAALVRFAVEGGGSVLVQESDSAVSGPVRAGRATDMVRDATTTLQEALAPVRGVARTILTELRKEDPHELAVEFGVCLTAEAGVVVARTEAASHLTVSVTWKKTDADAPVP